MENKYSKGKIYAIKSNNTDKIYIGSTILSLNERFGSHKRKKILHSLGKYGFVTSFEILNFDDSFIELIEDYPCNNIDELRKRERFFIEEYSNICVNKHIPSRTKSEYREVFKEERRMKKKKQLICTCGLKCSDRNMARHKRSKLHLERMQDQ